MEQKTGASLVLDETEAVLEIWGMLDQAVAVQVPPRDPMRAYIDGLTSAVSRATAIKRLRAVARLVEVPDYAALPWGQLRAHHVAFIRSKLVKAEAAPATVNLTLAVLRGIARQARDFNLMTDEEYRRIAEVKPHKELAPAARPPRPRRRVGGARRGVRAGPHAGRGARRGDAGLPLRRGPAPRRVGRAHGRALHRRPTHIDHQKRQG